MQIFQNLKHFWSQESVILNLYYLQKEAFFPDLMKKGPDIAAHLKGTLSVVLSETSVQGHKQEALAIGGLGS